MAKGTVKWFNAQKGYGFIEQADGGKDVFVHVTGLAPGVTTLSEGQAVEFEVPRARRASKPSTCDLPDRRQPHSTRGEDRRLMAGRMPR